MASSKSFFATSNQNLQVLNNPAYQNNLLIDDIDQLIRQTPSFQQLYGPPLVPDEHELEYYQGTWNEPASIPHVVLIRGSHLDSTTVPTLSTNSGLIGSVLTAYNTHQNLELRPDDVWITILAQFSAYVNGRAEELRDKIVSHEGQKELQVIVPGTIYSVDFGEINLMFLDKISENIKDSSLREWFLPGFSTSSSVDDMSAAAMAMCSFQAYFAYRIELVCGIPEVTLLGSVEDWESLRLKVDRLLEFDDKDKTMSEKWVPLLQSILDNFVESAKNGSDNNMHFWDSIISNERVPNGCAAREELTGWMSTFTMFNEKGELYADLDQGPWPQVALDDIHHNVATCPVSVNDNGVEYNATLFVGQMAYDFVVDETNSVTLPPSVESIGTEDGKMRVVKPRNDWALSISEGFESVPYARGRDELMDGTAGHGKVCPMDLYDPATKVSIAVGGGGVTVVDETSNRLAWIIPVAVLAALVLLGMLVKIIKSRSSSTTSTAAAKSAGMMATPEQPQDEVNANNNENAAVEDEEEELQAVDLK